MNAPVRVDLPAAQAAALVAWFLSTRQSANAPDSVSLALGAVALALETHILLPEAPPAPVVAAKPKRGRKPRQPELPVSGAEAIAAVAAREVARTVDGGAK